MGGAPNENADSADLEALFDSVASQAAAPVPGPAAKPSSVLAAASEGGDGIGDSDDLQALFDNVAARAGKAGEATASSAGENWDGQDRAFNKIGQLVRQLHDSLLGLGYDKFLEKTVSALPDAKDRLAYVANLTEQAACRVLNATDIALPVQEQIAVSSKGLGQRWERVFAGQMNVADFRKLAEDTRGFLNQELPSKIDQTNAQLMEIMMAQDFQDLTGQVIKKIVVLAQEMETQMMQVLIDVMPEVRKTDEVTSLLNGPVVNAGGQPDVVVNQQQVDDLLGSLGF